MEKKPQFTGPRPQTGAPRPKPGQKPRPGDKNSNGKDQHAINDRIRAREVRLVGDNVEQGIYPIEKARHLAEEMELDLVEITSQADPLSAASSTIRSFSISRKSDRRNRKPRQPKWW